VEALDEHIEDLAFVVDGAPQMHSPAGQTTLSSRRHRSLDGRWAA
jgi:hypothetical protein